MNLLLDIGNSRIKWALAQGSELQASAALAHGEEDLPGALSACWSSLEKPRQVVIASVVRGIIIEQVEQWIEHNWNCAVRNVQSRASAGGVTNAYLEPGKLGVDRWLALLAARNYYPGDVGIVDAGSALTIDLLAADGHHLGGLIAPGVETMLRSLTQERITLAVEGVSADVPKVLLGRDTQAGVSNGVLYCLVSYIDRMTEEISRQRGGEVTWLLTGGDTQRLRPRLGNAFIPRPDLVLEGLALVADSDPC